MKLPFRVIFIIEKLEIAKSSYTVAAKEMPTDSQPLQLAENDVPVITNFELDIALL